jgi:hypothetical protein
MTLSQLKTGIAGAVFIAAISIPLVQQHSLATLRSQPATQASEAQRAERLQVENTRLRSLQPAPDELAQLRQDFSNVLSLRGEIALTRSSMESWSQARRTDKWARSAFSSPVNHIASSQGEAFAANGYFASDGWSDVGAASPEAALQSALAASKSTTSASFLDLVDASSDTKVRLSDRLSKNEADNFPWSGAQGIKVEAKGGVDEDGKVEYVCEFDWEQGRPIARTHSYLGKNGGEWKLHDIIVERPEWELIQK